jgi:two-component system cell cycle response regulator DivK
MSTILYIEDNEDNVALLRLRLELEGFEVLIAPDGATGIASAAAHRPDIILMDLDLPDIDGFEATRRIRDDAQMGRIPVIAVSAHAMPEHRERASAAGCDEFEAKPVDFGRLLGKIRKLLQDQNGQAPA